MSDAANRPAAGNTISYRPPATSQATSGQPDFLAKATHTHKQPILIQICIQFSFVTDSKREAFKFIHAKRRASITRAIAPVANVEKIRNLGDSLSSRDNKSIIFDEY
ncbi:unnamed protein product [Ceratitis capitata]|uniref:(Mediterranean fruit fly) hypothetical protein n=1 Tax=Ceratitis capitata TaxID=7213 RepID=A0A811VLU2_CERCA|nr:unnamed protein product [Ceratitis capitata]